MAFRDRFGLELTTHSAEAAERYQEGVDASLSGNVGADLSFAAAVEADPGFALGHVALGRSLQLLARMPEAQAAKARARELATATSRRERQHVETVATAIDGDGPGAMRLLREHIAEYPRDAFVLSQAVGPFSLLGFGGGPDWRAETYELLTPLASTYGDDWWFLSSYGFICNEVERFEEARRMAERSLELYPRSGHGAHTMGHVFFEQGDHTGGKGFLDGWLPGYAREATLYSHLTWHLALFELNRGNTARVMSLWDETLAPTISPGNALITLADASALAWRCDLYGAPRPEGSREELAGFARKAFPRPGITFADMHAAMALAAAGDAAAVEELIAGLHERLASGKLAAGEVAIALVRAIAAYAAGEFEEAVRLLEPWIAEVVRVGGSNAQREVFEDTLLAAYLNAGRFEQAEVMLQARLQRRPNPRDEAALARALAERTAASAN